MLREAREKGIHIYEKSKEWEKFSKQNFDINGKMHNEQAKFPGSIFKSEVRKWNVHTHGPIHIHQSVLKRKRNSDNGDHPPYDPWVLKVDQRKTEE
jgi:hypothetical protein